jgi:hypothetical protein
MRKLLKKQGHVPRVLYHMLWRGKWNRLPTGRRRTLKLSRDPHKIEGSLQSCSRVHLLQQMAVQVTRRDEFAVRLEARDFNAAVEFAGMMGPHSECVYKNTNLEASAGPKVSGKLFIKVMPVSAMLVSSRIPSHDSVMQAAVRATKC